MLIQSLLRQFDENLPLDHLPAVSVTGVCEDSRLVRFGELFIARPGTKEDGSRYMEDARAPRARWRRWSPLFRSVRRCRR